ncbi:IclR family transcriptional regulator [Cytobacillus gottheilii]|uniref:IclR family transcriptional regulator n=1 Tax=Cytobacillus gottheilii TaxID=859144 RepID=UPI003CF0DFD7
MKAVEKAFQLLELIVEHPRSFMDLITLMKSNKATIHRYVSTLESLQYIEKNENDDYQISYKFQTLGTKVFFELKLFDMVKHQLEELSVKVNESAIISTYRHDTVFYLGKVESPSALRIVVDSGKTAPLYCVASGKLYLSHLSETELEDYLLRQKLSKITDNTITDQNVFREEIRKIRSQGYAVDHEEWEEYLRGIAVPIYDHTGKIVASLSIAGVSYRFTPEKVEFAVSESLIVAGKISNLLGYKTRRSIVNEK